MSWIVAGIAVGTWAVDKIGKGVTAMGQAGDVGTGVTAAEDIQKQQLGLLGERKDISTSAANLGYEAAESQFAGGQRDVSMGTQTGMRDIQAGGNVAMAKSGLATSGTIESKVQTQTKDLLGKYKSDMTKLFETRDLSKTQADLSYRKGEMSAEDAYQNTLTDINAQPTGFLEGMFS